MRSSVEISKRFTSSATFRGTPWVFSSGFAMTLGFLSLLLVTCQGILAVSLDFLNPENDALYFHFTDTANGSKVSLNDVLSNGDAYLFVGSDPLALSMSRLIRLDSGSVNGYRSFKGNFYQSEPVAYNFRLMAKEDGQCILHFALLADPTEPKTYEASGKCDEHNHTAVYLPLPSRVLEVNESLAKGVLQGVRDALRRTRTPLMYVQLTYALWRVAPLENFSVAHLHFHLNNYFASFQILPGVQLSLNCTRDAAVSAALAPASASEDASLDGDAAYIELNTMLVRRRPAHVAIVIIGGPLRQGHETKVIGLAAEYALFTQRGFGTILMTTRFFGDPDTIPFMTQMTNTMAHELLHLLGATHLDVGTSVMGSQTRELYNFLPISPITQLQVYSALQSFMAKPCTAAFCRLLPQDYPSVALVDPISLKASSVSRRHALMGLPFSLLFLSPFLLFF